MAPASDHHAAWASDRQLQVKPGPSAVSTVRLGKALLRQPVEHEQHGRRRHVAVLLQHGTLVVERALVEA